MTNNYNNADFIDIPQSPFERLKRIDHEGNEYWSARDLMDIFEYPNYSRFKNVLLKAQISCENSGYDPDDHFYDAVKMVTLGSDAQRKVEDTHLTRYACYLVVQNADPNKKLVAAGQTYFAVKTHLKELEEKEHHEIDEKSRRLRLRERIRHQNTDLASAAKGAGVHTPLDFAVFQDHGYKGLYSLYNGLTAQEIHRRKKLKKSQQILDHMGTTELAANLFRSTQAEDKLCRDNIRGKTEANRVHYEAGQVVRRAIAELGGTMPENLPAVESIKKVEREKAKQLTPRNPTDDDQTS